MDGQKIVAHISYNPKSKRRNGSIFMINLTVLPEYRRQGIAQDLIYVATNYYINNGYTLLTSVSVDKDNIPAVNLYQKVGFEIREPICEADEDDEQYIMDSTLQNIKATLENRIVKDTKK
jgi:ribosomal protein S18 acetylase RimI-like enzyme